jgi:peroxiredoxin
MLLARRVALATAAATAASFSTARASMAPVVPLPSTAALADAPLKPLLASTSAVCKAKDLWAERPVVILAVRRPGCQLCRAEVSELQGIKAQLDKAGVRLVAVLHEEREEQVAEFKSEYWPAGELFLDETKEVFRAVGGGQVRRGSLLAFLNPFSRIWCASPRAWANERTVLRSHVVASNRVRSRRERAGRTSRTPTAWWRRATWWATG